MAYKRQPYFVRLTKEPERIPTVASALAAMLQASANSPTPSETYRYKIGAMLQHLDRSRSPAYNRTVDAVMRLAAQTLEGRGLFAFSAALFHHRTAHPRYEPSHVRLTESRRLTGTMRQTDADTGPSSDALCLRDRYWALRWLEAAYPVTTCISCAEVYVVDDCRETWNYLHVCPTCAPANFSTVRYYNGRLVPDDELSEAEDEDGNTVTVCEHDDNFEWDEDAEILVHRNRNRVLRGYHTSRDFLSFMPDDWTNRNGNRYLGVELEVEITGGANRDNVVKAIHRDVNDSQFGKNLFFETDGSLQYGFEMITQPRSLPEQRELFKFLDKPALVRNLRSHGTATCGLHVHVSRSGLTNHQIARVVTFTNDPANEPFIVALARRYNTGYCRVYPKQLADAHLPGDRYESVNLTRNSTIEFRLFRGSLKYRAVIAAIEFCHAILEFCAVPERTASALNYATFLAWCESELADETATLRAYAQERMGAGGRVIESTESEDAF